MTAPTVNLSSVIKAYDVRGTVPDQLDARVVRAIGAAFAEVVVLPEAPAGQGAKAVVGYDMRPSSPELSAAFADGVASRGVDVTVIGLCSTDGLYFASGFLDVPGAMFTASHNPAQYNGIKLCRAGAKPVGRTPACPPSASWPRAGSTPARSPTAPAPSAPSTSRTC